MNKSKERKVCVVCGRQLESNPGDSNLPPGFCSWLCLDYYSYSIIMQINYLEERGSLPGHTEEQLDDLFEAYSWIIKYRLWWRKPVNPIIC